MSMPQLELQADNHFASETPEVKKRAQYHDVDESLSEWELARLTSKTWSMEQE
ncbi:MAG: hypothetical protein JJ934_04555 [Pseudomonadales bacterium]|nr:hypothetical protein [Pseudomonadales bacterium]MBO6564185.1 hypothetical protein [Pseudomonadales bacterium]MBO6597044.1 hypothetical protein [Pseudomonadales bacterium]MBO6656140.1 hypothetical protein [Pseudomonadales bacterium]MBO6703687.1 hypothetical protein [Pseudomonadales bacterium]